ncbi:hypothetical protein EVAR_78827_1 [Eumeta japonica]|uniref:Uncharacterized protein n=1 Tax=Eumeta variegata TaxID=151549 RepID=A0A4C1ZE11_EUMVA|nr:hypothetical protein EVAR_78827_1 [Eumeta japonica]
MLVAAQHGRRMKFVSIDVSFSPGLILIAVTLMILILSPYSFSTLAFSITLPVLLSVLILVPLSILFRPAFNSDSELKAERNLHERRACSISSKFYHGRIDGLGTHRG